MEAIEVKEVTKHYGDYLALDGISLTVPEQSVYGLLGPNGAGKTTLIRILNQITAPDSGEVLFKGERLSQQHIARIGYLPEERGLYKKMKVGEQAIYLAQLKGVRKDEAEKRLKAWFKKFEIFSWWDKKVEELSKGMQQKIQFITTVIHQPDILILDEPFSGFDPINANLLKETILDLKDKGATILLSTHNMASVEEMCDRIMLINKGHKILEGRVRDIKQQFDTHTYKIVVRTDNMDALRSLAPSLDLKMNAGETPDEAEIDFVSENPNEIVRKIMDFGQIVSYQEMLPSMNDIFIQEVQSQNMKP